MRRGDSSIVQVGTVTKPQGIRGEFRVFVLGEGFDKEWIAGSVYIEQEGVDGEWADVESARIKQGLIILKLSHIHDRNSAESYRGATISIRSEDRPRLPADEYYDDDLVGFSVQTVQGEKIGSLVEILQMPAQKMFIVRTGNNREVMIPAVDAFIKEICADTRIIRIDPIEGLLD